MSLKSDLLSFLENIQNLETSSQRIALITAIGLDRLRPRISWEGSKQVFLVGFLELLISEGQVNLESFLRNMADDKLNLVGLENRQRFVAFADRVHALTSIEWDREIQDVIDDTSIIDNWLKQQDKRISSITDKLMRKPNQDSCVQSPLINYWNQFISDVSWIAKLKVIIDITVNLSNELSMIPDISKLVGRLNRIDFTANYYEIHNALDKATGGAFFPVTIKNIDEFIKNLKQVRHESETEGLIHRAEELKGCIYELRETVEKPKFRRCFPILGGMGSGKTHFLYTLLDLSNSTFDRGLNGDIIGQIQENKFNYLILHLQLSNHETLQEAIVSEISNFTSNTSLRELSEIDSLCTRRKIPIRIVVFIDDFHKWNARWSIKGKNFQDELSSLIIESTRLQSIYWCLTLLDTNYDRVAEKGYQSLREGRENSFWLKYSFFDNKIQRIRKREHYRDIPSQDIVPSIGGWIYLDYINLSKKIGLNIIRNFIQTSGEALESETYLTLQSCVDLDSFLTDGLLFYISNPFLAWITIDASKSQSLELTLSFSYFELVELFQEDILLYAEKLVIDKNIELNSATIYPVISNIIKIVIGEAEFSYCYNELVRQIAINVFGDESARSFSLVEQAFKILADIALIEIISPAIDCNCNRKVFILFEPFWLWRFARDWITNHLESESYEQSSFISSLDEWMIRVENKGTKEGAMNFILLLVDSSIRGGANIDLQLERATLEFEPSLVEKIYTKDIIEPHFSSSSAWLVGHQSTEQIQSTLVKLAELTPNLITTKRSLFCFLYFLSKASLRSVSIADRIYLIKSYYTKIHLNDLSRYFLFCVRQLIPEIRNKKDMLRSMNNLDGCDVMQQDILRDIALISINQIIEICNRNTHQVLNSILQYLKMVNKSMARYNPSQAYPWIRLYYYEWIICEFCAFMIEFEGMNAFHLLMQHKWFSPRYYQFNYKLGICMEREATIKLGSGYRNSKISSVQYINTVESLVHSGNLWQMKLAFFLIFHTVSTKDSKVDLVFQSFLRVIVSDHRVRKQLSQFQPFINVNIGRTRYS